MSISLYKLGVIEYNHVRLYLSNSNRDRRFELPQAWKLTIKKQNWGLKTKRTSLLALIITGLKNNEEPNSHIKARKIAPASGNRCCNLRIMHCLPIQMRFMRNLLCRLHESNLILISNTEANFFLLSTNERLLRKELCLFLTNIYQPARRRQESKSTLL